MNSFFIRFYIVFCHYEVFFMKVKGLFLENNYFENKTTKY